ncbi:MAG: hypothetical protein KME06_07790 [Kastovskya adunca ATA6-11-RM4]|nr:hypothetical protein [Kastovskya adunca ATA6-11-RM4]
MLQPGVRDHDLQFCLGISLYFPSDGSDGGASTPNPYPRRRRHSRRHIAEDNLSLVETFRRNISRNFINGFAASVGLTFSRDSGQIQNLLESA